jgi:hypothetical protein
VATTEDASGNMFQIEIVNGIEIVNVIASEVLVSRTIVLESHASVMSMRFGKRSVIGSATSQPNQLKKRLKGNAIRSFQRRIKRRRWKHG